MLNIKDRIPLFPIKSLLSFLVFTEVFYFVGPINYQYQAPFLTALFFVAINVALYKGYMSGLGSYKKRRTRDLSLSTIHHLILVGLIISLVSLAMQMGTDMLSPSAIANKFVYALQNSGDVYHEKLENSRTTVMTYVFMLLAPIRFAAMCIGVYSWSKLSSKYKILVGLILFIDLFGWVTSGTRKGLMDDVLIIGYLSILARPVLLNDRKRRRELTIAMLTLLGLFLFYFLVSNLSRGGKEMSEMELEDLSNIRQLYKTSLSPVLVFSLAGIEGYLCQGYRALDYALASFVYEGYVCFTFGFGNNWFFINLFEHLAPGLDILGNTYQGYLSRYGIDPMINWHSAYVWFANDVTFIGVPFLLYLIGRFFAKVWLDAYYRVKISSVPLSCLFIIMILYFFANNQVLSFSMITFVVTLFLYKTRMRF